MELGMDEMDEMEDQPASITPELLGSNGASYRPRGYQLEMLEASQQQNIIVAVSRPITQVLKRPNTRISRWILAVGKLTCKLTFHLELRFDRC